MTVRESSAADETAIAGLARLLHGEDYRPLRKPRQESKSFVAEADGCAVGWLLATLTDYGLASYGMVEELVVDAGHRGQGHGAALAAACEAWLSAQGVEVVFVSAADEDAEGYYAAHGFRRCTGSWLFRPLRFA